jgi:hypothetical protein
MHQDVQEERAQRLAKHLTPDEVDALFQGAKGNRHGHRDATMILLAV